MGISSKALCTLPIIYRFLGYFGLMTISSVSLIIFINNVEQIWQGNYFFSSFCFLLMFLVAVLSSGRVAPSIFIFLIPLLPTLNLQLGVFWGISMASLPMAGFDLVAGYFFGALTKHLLYAIASKKKFIFRELTPPWPFNIVLLVITFSTGLAVIRNAWSSASPIDLQSIYFNLNGFKGLGWFEDYRPFVDWVAYVMAAGSFTLALNFLKYSKNRLTLVFRPLMAGLFLSGILALIQSKTGIGFEAPPIYKDIFGYAPYGFQPDLHAFAGYTLLGVIGMWGYMLTTKSKFERLLIVLIMIVSWYGLIVSSSKASIVFALLLSFFWLLWFVKQAKGGCNVSVLKMGIFIPPIVGLIIYLAFQYGFSFAPQWLMALIGKFLNLNISSFREMNYAFSDRPAIWLIAMRMWINFPIFGVGQGNFYQLSPLLNFENFTALVNGENAHNYFLQTLAETGIVGVSAFLVLILAPLFLYVDRREFIPAVIALFSLFLGNIFAHSFLVRENLFLASIILALMYSFIPRTNLALWPYKFSGLWNHRPCLKFLPLFIFFVIAILGAREIYRSFYGFPFRYGAKCFINKPLTQDRWSSGLYEVSLPIGSHGVELSIKVARPNLQKFPLEANFEILDSGNRVLASQAFEWKESGPQKLVISLPNGATIQDLGSKVALRLSSCYTPRNLGESIDGRRLGVIVDSSIIH